MAAGGDQRLVVRVGQVLFALPARASEGILALPAYTADVFQYGGNTVVLVDLRRKLELEAQDGCVVLARTGGLLRGFVVDEVLGVAPPEARRTALPPGLPAHTFQGALLHAERIALLSDFEALYALEDAGTALRTLAVSPPVTPTAHLPLHEVLSEAAAHLRDGRQPAAASPETKPYPEKPPAGTVSAPQQTESPVRQVATSVTSPSTPSTSRLPSGTSHVSPEEALTTPIGKIRKIFVLPVLATAAVAGLVVLLLPFFDLSTNKPGTLSSPPTPAMVAPTANQASVSSTVPPPPQTATAPSSQHESPAPVPVTQPPEPAPTARVYVERAADGVTLVVERGDQREQGEKVTVHTVVKGDTLWAIAARYLNDPWAYKRLAADSAIENPDVIQVGDKVRIIER